MELVSSLGSESVSTSESGSVDSPSEEDSFEEEGLSIDLEFVDDASEQDGDSGEASDPAEPESVIDEDAVDTNLELARAYIDMGDHDGARELIESVLAKGDLSQQAAAQDLLKSLS